MGTARSPLSAPGPTSEAQTLADRAKAFIDDKMPGQNAFTLLGFTTGASPSAAQVEAAYTKLAADQPEHARKGQHARHVLVNPEARKLYLAMQPGHKPKRKIGLFVTIGAIAAAMVMAVTGLNPLTMFRGMGESSGERAARERSKDFRDGAPVPPAYGMGMDTRNSDADIKRLQNRIEQQVRGRAAAAFYEGSNGTMVLSIPDYRQLSADERGDYNRLAVTFHNLSAPRVDDKGTPRTDDDVYYYHVSWSNRQFNGKSGSSRQELPFSKPLVPPAPTSN